MHLVGCSIRSVDVIQIDYIDIILRLYKTTDKMSDKRRNTRVQPSCLLNTENLTALTSLHTFQRIIKKYKS